MYTTYKKLKTFYVIDISFIGEEVTEKNYNEMEKAEKTLSDHVQDWLL